MQERRLSYVTAINNCIDKLHLDEIVQTVPSKNHHLRVI